MEEIGENAKGNSDARESCQDGSCCNDVWSLKEEIIYEFYRKGFIFNF